MAKLKIAGTWAGILEVELEEWTVPMLREEVAKRSSCGAESINLICAGKVLKDGDGTEKLTQLGVKNNAKILASRVCVEEGKSLGVELMAEEERSNRLSRVKWVSSKLLWLLFLIMGLLNFDEDVCCLSFLWVLGLRLDCVLWSWGFVGFDEKEMFLWFCVCGKWFWFWRERMLFWLFEVTSHCV